MSLRTRISATAALAVALVVVIAAVAIYLGVRAELRGEVDNSLRDRASATVRLAGDRGPGAPPREGDGRSGAGRVRRRRARAPHAAARAVRRPRGLPAARASLGARHQAPGGRGRDPGGAAGAGDRPHRLWLVLHRHDGVRHAPARAHRSARPARRDPGGAAARRGRPPARPRAARADPGRRGRCGAGRGAGAPGSPGPRWPRSTASRAAPRSWRATPTRRIGSLPRARTSWAGSHAASTRRSTRSSAPWRLSASSWPTRATSCAPP